MQRDNNLLHGLLGQMSWKAVNIAENISLESAKRY